MICEIGKKGARMAVVVASLIPIPFGIKKATSDMIQESEGVAINNKNIEGSRL